MKKIKFEIEQRNKFLDELGLKKHEYGVNFIMKCDRKKDRKKDKKRRKRWKKQQKLYGFDERETWNLYEQYAEWLYSHLKMFLEEAKIIDLSFWKVEYHGKTYTEEEAIEKILKWTGYFLKNRDREGKEEKAIRKLRKATELWAVTFQYVSW